MNTTTYIPPQYCNSNSLGATSTERLFYLDTLRSLAILILIIYHSAMPYTGWDFHIQNPEFSSNFKWWMGPLHDLRMPLLFFIAGAVTIFSLKKRSNGFFAKERLYRLGWPVLVGIFIIVPPQLWAERVSQGQTFSSIWDFYQSILEMRPYPEGNLSWHHLWFVVYLLVYCLIGSLIFRSKSTVSKVTSRFFDWNAQSLPRILALSIPLVLTKLLLEPLFPETHALIGDWMTLLYYGLLYLFGYQLTQRPYFIVQIERNRRLLLTMALVLTAMRYGHYLFPEIIHEYWSAQPVFTWIALLAVLGYGKHYLNLDNKVSRYFSQRSYFIYIVHQTWIVLIAYWLLPLSLTVATKYLIVCSLSFVLSILSFEIFKHFPAIGVGVGIREKKS